MYVLFGSVAAILGLLSVWQRRRLRFVSIRLLSQSGKLGEAMNAFQHEKGYLYGGLLMAAAGIATVVFGLLTGR